MRCKFKFNYHKRTYVKSTMIILLHVLDEPVYCRYLVKLYAIVAPEQNRRRTAIKPASVELCESCVQFMRGISIIAFFCLFCLQKSLFCLHLPPNNSWSVFVTDFFTDQYAIFTIFVYQHVTQRKV